MKKAIATTLALTMALSLAACGSSTSSSSTAAESTADSSSATAETTTEGGKIGFLAPTLQTEFFIGIDNDLKAACEANGYEYTSVDFAGDSATAVTGIENMVTAGCDVIVAMVSDTSCDDALAAAQAEGVKIVECGVETAVYDCCLNVDQYNWGERIGEMASNWAIEQLGAENVNYVVYTTYQDADMQNRGQGIQDKIQEMMPEANLLEVVDIGKDIVGSGTSTTENMLQKYPDLNMIACYGDAAAVEAMEAIKAAGLNSDDFGIFSCDGTNQALTSIANNDILRGTIASEAIGTIMFEYSERLLAGETFDAPVMMEGTEVTKENISDWYTG